MRKSENGIIRWLYGAGVFLIIYLSLVKVAGELNDYPAGDWRSEIYADKSGYYIYLPAAFIYGFYESSYPDSIDVRIGDGFSFYRGKLVTKYTCGVALLTSPFFIITHLIQLASGETADGFSPAYLNYTYMAAIFYLLAGVIALWLFLRKRFSSVVSALTVLLIVGATNLFYYTFRDSLMSHVYSFALFGFLLLVTGNLKTKSGNGRIFLISLLASLIVIVRPSNVIFLPVILLLDVKLIAELKARLRVLFRPLNLLIILCTATLVFLPQLLYWNFISGNLFYYSYGNEGFIFWNSPEITKVMFSPDNGLLVYVPLFGFMVIGLLFMVFTRKSNGWLIFTILALHIYLVSSWHMPGFGCGFGHRTFIEYYALLSVPLAWLIHLIISGRKFLMMLFGGFIAVFLIWFNMKFSLAYRKCYEGGSSFDVYNQYLVRERLLPFVSGKYSLYTGYEEGNDYLMPGTRIHLTDMAAEGRKVNRITPELTYSDAIVLPLEQLISGRLFNLEATFQLAARDYAGDIQFVCAVAKNDSLVFYHAEPVVIQPRSVDFAWEKVDLKIEFPFLPAEGEMKLFFWNRGTTEILVDDLNIELKSYIRIGLW